MSGVSVAGAGAISGAAIPVVSHLDEFSSIGIDRIRVLPMPCIIRCDAVVACAVNLLGISSAL